MRRYDSRPAADALAARMKRDRVTGTVRPIVYRELCCAYEVIASGVFDAAGYLIAYYTTRRTGQIVGHRRGEHGARGYFPAQYTTIETEAA